VTETALEPALIRPAPVRVLRRTRVRRSTWVGVGLVMLYLSIIVLIPLAAVFWHAAELGPAAVWRVVSSPDTRASLQLSLFASLAVAAINAVVGTIIAWVLVRDEFPGKTIVNAFIDLPFALPTIVAGLTLLALYGPKSPLGVNLAYTRAAVLLALLFVTLPFVVRSVQPVLMELEKDVEEAASSLGARGFTVFRRIVLPGLLPAIISGAGLSFARAIGEFGSVVLISGNIPFKTQIAPVRIFGLVESGDSAGAAALAVVLLLMSFSVLLALTFVQRWGRRADELD
jgi:sulfate/thiosulfate transport system permease protein